MNWSDILAYVEKDSFRFRRAEWPVGWFIEFTLVRMVSDLDPNLQGSLILSLSDEDVSYSCTLYYTKEIKICIQWQPSITDFAAHDWNIIPYDKNLTGITSEHKILLNHIFNKIAFETRGTLSSAYNLSLAWGWIGINQEKNTEYPLFLTKEGFLIYHALLPPKPSKSLTPQPNQI